MVTYKVTLLSEEHGIDTTIDCNDDVFVLDAAEEQFLLYIIFDMYDTNINGKIFMLYWLDILL